MYDNGNIQCLSHKYLIGLDTISIGCSCLKASYIFEV